jgi:GTP-binding protein
MVADREGVATPYALFHLQERGSLSSPRSPVYEGMVIGEYSRAGDLDVNICARRSSPTSAPRATTRRSA